MSWYGRFQQGMNLNVWCRTDNPGGEPDWPGSRPSVEIKRQGGPGTVLFYALMASYTPGVVSGLFNSTVFLGETFGTEGRYRVAIRWVDQDGNPRQIVGSFELVGGGDPAGTVIAMTEVARPDARYLLTSTDGGTISRRKNPR